MAKETVERYLKELYLGALFSLHGKKITLERIWERLSDFFRWTLAGPTLWLLAFLVFFYIIALVTLAFVELTGINYSIKTQNFSYVIGPIISQFNLTFTHVPGPINRDEVISLTLILFALLSGIIIASIFRKEDGVIVLPFEADKELNLSGVAITNLLVSNLKKINRLHDTESNQDLDIKLETFCERLNLPKRVPPRTESLSTQFDSLGEFTIGPTSLSLGKVLVLLRELFGDSSMVISGSLQEHGSDLNLTAHIKGTNNSWSVHQKTIIGDIDLERIASLISDLTLEISYDLEKKSETTRAKSKKGFKEYTKALDNYIQYKLIADKRYMDVACKNALRSINFEPNYIDPFYLLYNIEIAYLNRFDIRTAERLARHLVTILPDSMGLIDRANFWFTWGKSLRMLNLNEEAICCYQMARELLYKIETQELSAEKLRAERDELLASIYCMEGISYRNRCLFEEAARCFRSSLALDENDGFTWGHYGITLESWSKEDPDKYKTKINMEKVKSFVKAFEIAIILKPDFASVHASLARIYKNSGNTRDGMMHLKKAKFLMNIIKKDTEYNQACFEVIFGNYEEALALLEIALIKQQVSPEWLMADPDMAELRVHSPSRFNEVNKIRKGNDVDLLITIAAIRRKFDREFSGEKIPALKVKADDRGSWRTKPEDASIEEKYCKEIRELIGRESAFLKARYYSVCGNVDKALNHLHKALKMGELTYEDAFCEPDFEFISDDSRFTDVLYEFLQEHY